MAEQRNQQPAEQRQPSNAAGSRSVKSMLFTMLPMVIIVLGMGALTGRCSFSPMGPSVAPGSAPKVDAAAELRSAARRVEFPVVEPDLPDLWQANSSSVRQPTPKTRAVRVGWLTDRANYLRLSQSNASEGELVAFETEQRPNANGTVKAAGTQWVVYDSIRSEVAWVTEHNGVRLLITGDGTEAEFRTLARAAVTAPVLTPLE